MFKPGTVRLRHDDRCWTFSVIIDGNQFICCDKSFESVVEAKQAMRDFVAHMNEKV